MKNLLTLSLFVLAVFSNGFSQPPQSFKYQVIIRDNAGDIMANQTVGIRISIHSYSPNSEPYYQETFTTTTNVFGLVNLEIGSGTPVIGTFSAISWRYGSKFLEVEIDPTGGSTYISMGTSELLSVPYALYAGTTGDTSMWEKNINNVYYNKGNVGIGITNPIGELHVTKLAEWLGIVFDGSGLNDMSVDYSSYTGIDITTYYVEVTNAISTPNLCRWTNDDGTTWTENVPMSFSGIGVGFGVTIGFVSLTGHTLGNFWTWEVSPSYMDELVVRNGNVGIGTADPAAKLEVDGQVKVTGGNPGLRKSLMSDAVGLASWQLLKINDLFDGLSDTSNVFLGFGAGLNDDGDNFNTAVGIDALKANTSGIYNTALGFSSLDTNITGYENTATGAKSLRNNTSGNYNTASGAHSLYQNTTGSRNTAIGTNSLFSNSTGDYNTAIGTNSLYANSTGAWNTSTGYFTMFSNTTGHENTATGTQALFTNSTGNYNTATGVNALYYNTIGNENTANGYESLFTNSTGNYNTAIGHFSLINNTTGDHNTADGYKTLFVNTTGKQNTATGSFSLYHNHADYNTAFGYKSLYTNSSGSKNTANGYGSLLYNTTGNENSATGSYSLYKNTTGDYNSILGYESGYNNNIGNNNTFIGYKSGYSNASGSGNVFIGNKAGYYQAGSNKLYIGNDQYWPLIYGEFNNGIVNICGSLAIGTTAAPQGSLDVVGNVIIRDQTNLNVVIELGTGLDYAEGFDVADDKSAIEPGTVLCIDPESPGNLVISKEAYDTKVAGIVAGANNLKSGITLGTGSHDFNVALAGRVYCNAEAIHHGIHVGDLLTTSALPGYAMKYSGRKGVGGAILGKAMQPLGKGEKGQILVLVSLQ